jgi:Ca2+-binding EF-hand superfamily protein
MSQATKGGRDSREAALRQDGLKHKAVAVLEGPKWESDGRLSGTKTCRVNGGQQAITPTRGMLYSVFQDLDVRDEGRITYSTLEEAAMQCGMRQDQAKKLYSIVDPQRRGYVTMHDWGRREIWPTMSEFTRVYVQMTRGGSGKYKRATEISTLYAALQMALMKLKLKNNSRSVSHERLVQAFSFIDNDGSGSLDPQEFQDAFNGLGIYVGDKVIEDAMKAFDKDHSGSVDYNEFISVLFPNLSKGLKMSHD